MARDIRTFTVTVTAGTLASAPQTDSLAMPARVVTGVRVRIPPGPAGQVGWFLSSGGQRMLPSGAGEYIIGDDEVIDWPLEGQLESGAWQLTSYNTGVYDHSLYLTFYLQPLGVATPASLPQPLQL